MEEFLSYKGYRGSINIEDNYYWGRVLGLQRASLGYDGKTLDELEAEFRNCIDFYISVCKEVGDKPEVSDCV